MGASHQIKTSFEVRRLVETSASQFVRVMAQSWRYFRKRAGYMGDSDVSGHLRHHVSGCKAKIGRLFSCRNSWQT